MLQAKFKKHTLQFKRPSGTSRGVLKTKESWFIKLYDSEDPTQFGIGECSIIKGLSYDDRPDLEHKIQEVIEQINRGLLIRNSDIPEFPALQFALESAFLDYKTKGDGILFPSAFTSNEDSIKINGLIWMGDIHSMNSQIEEKLNLGFNCLKLKIGAINFEDELELLKQVRSRFLPKDLEIRVDANGAFNPQEALQKLDSLSKLKLHSIEQPIKQGQIKEMANLCAKTPLAIALDEELIGITDIDSKEELLKVINPQYIILKPSLLGGFSKSKEWIDIAKKEGIEWWITSALESNIGLNAIAQWTYTLKNLLPQGLGTGQLYTNNIASSLHLNGDQLTYDRNLNWDFNEIW